MTIKVPSPYVAHDGDVSRDRDAVLSIWHGNLGNQNLIASKYDWFYLDGPDGPPLLQLLQHTSSKNWVGTVSAGPRRMQWLGRDILAGLLVDMAIMQEHRSLGPALILQQGLIAASKHQLDLLIGFPNPKAEAIFKRIGYDKLADVVRYARVLRHARYLRNILPGWLATPLATIADIACMARDAFQRRLGPRLCSTWSDHADSRMDQMWEESPHSDGLVAIRDSRRAKWRFDDSPLASTRYLLITARGEDRLLAWFAIQTENEILHVRDFWSVEGDGGLGKPIINTLLAVAHTTGAVAISVEIAGAEAHLKGWKDCGFTARGNRPVFGHWCSSEKTSRTVNVFLTSADEDE